MQRLTSWLRRRRAHDAALGTLLLRELPGKLARKGADAARQALNRLRAPRTERVHAGRIRRALQQAGDAAYVVVAVPDVLHCLLPCLALATRHASIALVLNGMRPWEERLLGQAFPALPRARLEPVRGSVLPHGRVIDLLLRHADRDFGLHDPDLYVFDAAVFEDLSRAPDEIAVGAFGFGNESAGLVFPTTHLLSLDVARLQALMARHAIGARIYRRTPRRLVAPLAALGLGDHNFVKPYLTHYDPLNLLLAVARSEGARVRVLDCDESRAVHIGGVSYFGRSAALDYFHLRLLELPAARPFAARYRRRLVGALTPEEARRRLERRGARVVAERVERTVERLAAETAPAG